MKRLLLLSLLVSIIAHNGAAQQSWENVIAPFTGSTDHKYIVDDNGSVYTAYTEFDGFFNWFYISQYLNSNNTWLTVYSDIIVDNANYIKLDARGGTSFISFISDQTNKTVNVYSIASGTFTKLISENITDYKAYTNFDFKVGDVAGEYYWFMTKDIADEAMLVSYNGPGFTATLVDDLAGKTPDQLHLQQVGDTL